MKLFVIAVFAFLLWILQGVFYHSLWTWGLTATLEFDRQHAVEGEHAILKETISNAKFLPLIMLHVKFQMGKYLVFTSSNNFKITDNNYRSDIFSCMPWQEIRRNLEFVCTKRGYYSISELQMVSYDLFFSGHFVTSRPVDTSLYVYPRSVSFPRLQVPLRSLMGQVLAQQALLPDPFEIQSVRPYESYDPYRSINWKASARTGNLKVNVYAPTSSWQVMFLLDVTSDRIWKDEALTEEAIRLCGSYSQMLMKEGISVSLCTNGIDCLSKTWGYLEAGAGMAHGRTIMEMLTRIDIESPSQPAMEQILEEIFQSSLSLHNSSYHNYAWLYILVSPQQRSSLLEAYRKLCAQSPGSQWILPFRPGENIQLKQTKDIQIFPWEVPYDHSKAI